VSDQDTPKPTTDDPEHTLPPDADQATIEAMGLLSKAFETVERARGRLYDFHQLTGKADMSLDEAVQAFRDAGRPEVAERIEQEIIGRDVAAGRWTFQLVESYDDDYYRPFADLERWARDTYAQGKRHLYESQLKVERQQGKNYR
jgi:hypothetical protein